jgi:hypothetical protein
MLSSAARFGILNLEYTWVEKETARSAPRTHRAAADAAYWATFLTLLHLGQAELERRRVAAGESGIDFGPARWQPR